MIASDKLLEVQYYIAFVLQITIAAVMLRRRLYLQARYFFAYIIWQTFSVAVLYAVVCTAPRSYRFYGYWINNTVTVILGMAIVIEIFNRIFAPYENIRHMARILFTWAAVLLVALSGGLLFYQHTEYSGPLLTFLLVTERSVRVVQLGLILVLFAITKYLHLRWRNYLFGIALGFGFYALITLVVLVVRMTYGKPVMVMADLVWGTAYCAAVLIWTMYVLQPEVAKVPIVSLPSHELEKWDEALKTLLKK
ncbi:MAG: hypothetical protein ACXVZV_06040 [Terriglobales bacterium]